MRNFTSMLLMRKAMSKEVGAGGRLDIFLDSAHSHLDMRNCVASERLQIEVF